MKTILEHEQSNDNDMKKHTYINFMVNHLKDIKNLVNVITSLSNRNLYNMCHMIDTSNEHRELWMIYCFKRCFMIYMYLYLIDVLRMYKRIMESGYEE